MDHLSLQDCICAMEYLEFRHRWPMTDKERPGFMVLTAMIEKEVGYRLGKLELPKDGAFAFFGEIYSVAIGKKSFNEKKNIACEEMLRIKDLIHRVIGKTY